MVYPLSSLGLSIQVGTDTEANLQKQMLGLLELLVLSSIPEKCQVFFCICCYAHCCYCENKCLELYLDDAGWTHLTICSSAHLLPQVNPSSSAAHARRLVDAGEKRRLMYGS